MRRQSEWPLAAEMKHKQVSVLIAHRGREYQKQRCYVSQDGAAYLRRELESTWGGCHWEDRRPPEPTVPPRSGCSLSGQLSRAQSGLRCPAYPRKLQSPSTRAAPASDPYQPDGAEGGSHKLVKYWSLADGVGPHGGLNAKHLQQDAVGWLEYCFLCLLVH